MLKGTMHTYNCSMFITLDYGVSLYCLPISTTAPPPYFFSCVEMPKEEETNQTGELDSVTLSN